MPKVHPGIHRIRHDPHSFQNSARNFPKGKSCSIHTYGGGYSKKEKVSRMFAFVVGVTNIHILLLLGCLFLKLLKKIEVVQNHGDGGVFMDRNEKCDKNWEIFNFRPFACSFFFKLLPPFYFPTALMHIFLSAC